MEVPAQPTHGRLEDLVELLEVRIRANQQASPDRRPDAFQRHLELIDFGRATSTAPGERGGPAEAAVAARGATVVVRWACAGPPILTVQKRIELGQQALTDGVQIERCRRVGD